MAVARRRGGRLGRAGALALALLAGAAEAGGMYRWTDAGGGVHYADRPGGSGAEAVEPDSTRISVIDTVVVKDNAMRSVVEREVRRQQAQRTAGVKAADAAAASADRKRAAQCDALRRKISVAENTTGSLLNGTLGALDEQYWQACRR